MSEERDLEKELKEARDQFDAENQQIYDEVTKGNEELRRKQEKEAEEEEDTDEDPTTDKLESRGYKGNRESPRQRQIRLRQKALADRDKEGSTITRGPGQVFRGGKDTIEVPDRDMRTGDIIPNETELDEFGNPKFAQSIGFEVGANIALDKATIGLLGAPIPGARVLYALSNVAGSGIINYLAQRIRGTEFSLGELATASGLSLVPGANQAKTLKGSIGKATAKGSGLGATQVTSESLIDTGELPDAETLATGALFGGAAGGIFQSVAEKDQIGYALRAMRNRINNRPAGSDFAAIGTVGAAKRSSGIGEGEGISPEDFKKQFEPKKPTEGGFTKESIQQSVSEQDQELSAIYATKQATLGDTLDEDDIGFLPINKLTAEQKRIKFGRQIKADDLDAIVREEAYYGRVIPESKKQDYVNFVNDTRIGKKDRNNPSGRLRRNQKGYIGTMVYLNEVSLGVNPNTLGNNATVIKHISKEMGVDPVGLKKIIEDQGGEIVFQTESMAAKGQVNKISTLKDLVKAYMGRLQRYKDVKAFDKGHVFAAKNIIDDRDINSLTDFLNELEPEISRSIRAQLDDQTIEQLIKTKGQTKDIRFYETLVEGNRKRRNRQDPDKILADLLGTQYGLRESFLSFVYPERSLSNIIPIESKDAFAELYRKELLAEIKGLKADLRNSGQSSVGPATIDQLKIDVARSVAEGMKDNKLLNAIILVDDKINKRGMTEKGLAKPLPDNPVKTDDDGLIRGDTPE